MSLSVRRVNVLNLRTALRCYGIAQECLALAVDGKKHIATRVVDEIILRLWDNWQVGPEEALRAQENIDRYARQKVGIIAESYMNREWCTPTYEVYQ